MLLVRFPNCHECQLGFHAMPLKQDNLTSQHSWAFNVARTHERVQLLDKSGYKEPLFNWGTLHTCSGCDATAAWLPPPIWTFAAASICTRICFIFQQYLPVLIFAFLAQPAATANEVLWRLEKSTHIQFLLYLYQFMIVFLAFWCCEFADLLRPAQIV